jgi:hypothetical protein
MSTTTIEQATALAREAYGVIYDNLADGKSGFDIGMDTDTRRVYAVSSGCVYAGDVALMRNVDPADFGNTGAEGMTRDEFVAGSMEAFGAELVDTIAGALIED